MPAPPLPVPDPPAPPQRQFVMDPVEPTRTLVTVPDPSTLTGNLVSREIRALREVLEARLDGNDTAIVKLEASTARSIQAGVEQVRELYAEKFSSVNLTVTELHTAVDGRFGIVAEDIRRISGTLTERGPLVSREIEKEIGHLRTLIGSESKRLEDVSDQRFIRIDVGLSERDKRADQLALANSAALAAALAAQKEAAGEAQKSAALAISKSEAATAEAIKQGQTLFANGLGSLTVMVNDLKSRLDKGEGSRGATDPVIEARLMALTNSLSGLSSASDRRGGSDERQKEGSSAMIAIMAAVAAVVVAGIAILGLVLNHAH